MTFTQMVTIKKLLQTHSKPYPCKLFNQKPNESFDSFVNKVKHEAKIASFHGRQLEVAALGAEKIIADKHGNPNS